LSASIHSESFTSSSLPVDHNCSIEPVGYTLNNVSSAMIEYFFLAAVVQNLIEFETPLFLLIVHVTT